MPPTISPLTIGQSSYTVSSSNNAWFYLEVDLAAGEEAGFEINAVGATVTLSEGVTLLATISGAPFSNNDGNREIVTSAAGGFITIAVTAINDIVRILTVRASAIPVAGTCSITETGGGGLIRRVLADPTVSAPALAPVFEKTNIALTGTAQFTTVPAPGPPPAGTPAPPVLRARWSQQGPAGVSAPPPATIFFKTVVTAPPLDATPIAFLAPSVHSSLNLTYRLMAFYDENGNNSADASEPSAFADVAVTVRERAQHMLLVVDRSGSMLANMPGTAITRWEFARRAAHVWADLWSALRQNVSASDKAGIMVFEASSCGWTGAPANPIDILLPPGSLGGVGSLSVVTLDLGLPGSCTPIGDALIEAIDAFVGLKGASADDRFVILLLTDGYENSGAIVVEEDTPAPAGATAIFKAVRATGARASINARLAINTIGLGAPGSVQESVLQDLADEPSGAPPERGLYRLVQANELMSAFAQQLGDAVEAQVVTLNPNAPFPVNSNEERLVIVVQWDNIADELKVFRTVGANPEQQVAGPGAIVAAGVSYEKRGHHGFVSVDLPAHLGGPAPATTWRVEYWQNGVTQQPIAADRFLAMVDLYLKADISFDRSRYYTGGRVQVTCQISAGGQLVTDAVVKVELARPGESLGSFLAANSKGYKPGQAGGGDPLAPKAQMLQQLLRRKEQHELPVVTPHGIFRDGTDELWDDGLHRDGAAGDGVFSNMYLGLDKEGTYTWRFQIEGKTPEGEPFSRVLTRAFWVGVRVDPYVTKVDVNYDIQKPREHVAAQIIVTPADRNGTLLGPFRASQVSITSDDGQFLELNEKFASEGTIYPQPDKGDMLSHYDGRYSRIIAYNRGSHPTVYVAVQGREIAKLSL